jgi:hypothetical protein
VRVNFDVAGVYQKPFIIRIDQKFIENLFPHAFVTPAAESAMGVLPVSIIFGQIAPRCAGAQNPHHCIEEKSIVLSLPAPTTRAAR